MIKKEINLNIDYYNKEIVNQGIDELIEKLYPNDDEIEEIESSFLDQYFNEFLTQLSYNLRNN